MSNENKTETPTAKLRNQLSPLYGLADTVLLLKDNPQILDILLKQAEQCLINKENIKPICEEIESSLSQSKELLEEKEKERLKWFDIAYRDSTKLDLICEEYNEFKKASDELELQQKEVIELLQSDLTTLKQSLVDKEKEIETLNKCTDRAQHHAEELLAKNLEQQSTISSQANKIKELEGDRHKHIILLDCITNGNLNPNKEGNYDITILGEDFKKLQQTKTHLKTEVSKGKEGEGK